MYNTYVSCVSHPGQEVQDGDSTIQQPLGSIARPVSTDWISVDTWRPALAAVSPGDVSDPASRDHPAWL